MRAFELRERFGFENLKQVERAAARPGPYDVGIAVRVVSLNFRDLLMIAGQYNPKQKLPLVPVSDGVGEVVEVGERVTRVRVGDRVAAIFAQRWLEGEPTRDKLSSALGGPLDGMLAERVVLHEDGVVRVPAHLSDEEASTLPCAALTAWSALVTYGRVTAGDVVLVQGTGGVSTFALQFARLLGARPIVTSSSDEKLARATALGAAATINYVREPDWGKRARDIAGGGGVDLVVEVGGAGTMAQSLRAVRPGGCVSVIGVLAGSSADMGLLPILMQNVRLQGILVGHRAGFETMNRAIDAHEMRPVVDRVFAFEDAVDAFQYLASGMHFGKVCVRVSAP